MTVKEQLYYSTRREKIATLGHPRICLQNISLWRIHIGNIFGGYIAQVWGIKKRPESQNHMNMILMGIPHETLIVVGQVR